MAHEHDGVQIQVAADARQIRDVVPVDVKPCAVVDGYLLKKCRKLRHIVADSIAKARHTLSVCPQRVCLPLIFLLQRRRGLPLGW